MSNRISGSIIQEDSYSRALTILGYLFFVLLLIFAIDYGQLTLSLATVGVLMMQIVGERITALGGNERHDRKVDRRELNSALTYVIIDLGLFAALDLVSSAPGSLPGLSVFGVLSSLSFTNVLAIGSLFTVQIAIAEEKFFRGGAANLGARYGGPLLGILTSAVFFFAYHIPAENGDLLKLLIIGGDGAVLAWSDFQTRRIFPSMVAHMINNLAFVLIAATIGGAALGLHP